MSTVSPDSVAQDQIRAFFERWERLEGEKQAISDDLKELFAEAKGNGFDTKVLRKLFRDQLADANERSEFEALYDLYAAALNGALARDARDAREDQPDHDPITGEVIEPTGNGAGVAEGEAVANDAKPSAQPINEPHVRVAAAQTVQSTIGAVASSAVVPGPVESMTGGDGDCKSAPHQSEPVRGAGTVADGDGKPETSDASSAEIPGVVSPAQPNGADPRTPVDAATVGETAQVTKAPTPLPAEPGQRAESIENRPAEAKTLEREPSETAGSEGVHDGLPVHPLTISTSKGGQHDHSGEHIGRSDDEQRDAARVSRPLGRGEGADEGDQGQGAGASRADRHGGHVAGTVDREDQDGRGGHVGREARHEVAETRALPEQVNADGGDGSARRSAAPVVSTNVVSLRSYNHETHFLNSTGLSRLHGCLKPDMCGSSQPRAKLCFSCSVKHDGPTFQAVAE